MLVSIIAFNEARMLPMCLAHIPKGTPVLVTDGAYKDFPHEVPHSTDGTLEIARRWGAEVVECERAWQDQMQKRTAQLREGVCFLLDADELLHTDMPELPDDADVGWVTCVSPLYKRPFLVPRVLRVGKGWHFEGRHHWLYDADGELVTSHTFAGKKYRHVILPVLIENARDDREPIRNDEKITYCRARRQAEESFADEQSVHARPQRGKR
jgi:glycosyltransferase involved in cell wall biosynthesis